MKTQDIINISKEDPIGLLDKYCVPWLGADNDLPDLFGKYGYTYCGIGDGFNFIPEKTKEATELEAWKMLALCNIYWLNQYKNWYRESEESQEQLEKIIYILTHKKELLADKEKAKMIFQCQQIWFSSLPQLEDLKNEILGEE